jgi:hypothetical protein
MKDKLFWIALIIAGVILFNKMGSSSRTADSVEVQTKEAQERESRTDRSIDEPHFGDQSEPLKLPKKNGQSQSTANTSQADINSNTNRNQPDLKPQNQDKEISLGEYGSVTLPKKSGSTSENPSRSTNNQSAPTTNQNQGVQTVELNPQTKRGEGIMTDVINQPLLVLDGKVLQVSSLENSEIYMDENSFCTVSSGSNNVIYVMTGAQLMLTGNGNNNTIYYEKGSSVRNGINGSNNTLIELQSLNFK